MAEFDSSGKRLVTVVRVLEYHGTEEWITAVMNRSRIPVTGEFKAKVEGCFIRSGLVHWDVLDEGGKPNPVTEEGGPKPPIPMIPPTVQ